MKHSDSIFVSLVILIVLVAVIISFTFWLSVPCSFFKMNPYGRLMYAPGRCI